MSAVILETNRFAFFCFLVLSLGFTLPETLPAQQANESELAQYSEQAERAIGAKDWAAAARALEKLAQLSPDVPQVQGNLGMAYYSLSRILEASQAFERALKLNPKMAQAELMLGLCYAELGRNKEAVSILEPAFHHPADQKLGKLIGLDLQRAYAGLGHYAKAVGVSDELLSRYPNDPEILFHASRLYADRAYQTMTQLIQANPNSVWVHYANAEVHESLQRFDLAIAEYGRVLEMEPRMPGIHLRIGEALLRTPKDPKLVDEALSEFQQELAIAPQSADAEYEIGEIYRRRNQFDEALEHFRKAVQFQPDFEEAQIGLSRTLLNLGRPSEAPAHLHEAVRLNPQNEVSHFLLASAYKALGETTSYQSEMSLYQKYHAAGPRAGLRIPGAPEQPAVTHQELEPGAGSNP